MSKNVKRIILSEKQPNNKHIAWAKPSGDNIDLKIFEDNKWKPISGSSTSNKYTSDPNAPMLSGENIYNTLNAIDQELGFNPANLTDEQMIQEANELKSYKFATPKQGNAVLVDYDLQNNIFTFQCEDGSLITFTDDNQGTTTITGLRPDIDGYIIWKTTKDKLPVRENQEETDPGGDFVKSGLLSVQAPTDPSTEEVSTVINNNTGEIIDPLELHKLTNVIYSFDQTNCHPCYLINALYNVENLPPFIQGLAAPISIWRDMSESSTTQKYYYNYIINYSGATALDT